MKIKLKKFGKILTSRQDGKEALLAIQPVLKKASNKNIIIDFEGIKSLSPSWADEFLVPLLKEFKNDLILKNIKDVSAKKTISFLEEINKIKFKKTN